MRFFKPEQDSNKPETDKYNQAKSTVGEIVQDVIEYRRAKEERDEVVFEELQRTGYMS